MNRHQWIRRALLGTFIMAITFVLAHSINAFVSHSLTASTNSVLPVMAPHKASSETYDTKALVDSILAARLFPLPSDTGSLSGGGEATPPPGPPLNVAKSILLLGTAMNSSTDGFAILEDLSTKKQTLYHLQETVPAVGMIAQIEKDRILFRQGSQEEWLNLAIAKLSPGFERTISASAQPVSPRPVSRPTAVIPVSQVSSKGRRTLARQILIDTANNPAQVSQHARLVPMVVNERPQGILLEAVNHYSLYGELGFQSGDVLKRINGVELHDPTTFASIFQQLKNERTIKIDILRDDQPKTLALDVQ
jgi:general secretion pathway protein C